MHSRLDSRDDLTALSLGEAAARLRAGEISSLGLTDACLAAIDLWQPAINCFLTVDRDSARAAARAIDARRARGEALGPLAGIPLAHKDLFERAGRKLTAGSIILDTVPRETAPALRRLDAAGALDLGPLHLSEFAAGATGHNRHYGACRNPWDRARIPGGSSGGSAAAVAAGLVFGSLGTDTGGSLRLPAHFCGVAALRPAPGRVSLAGVFPRAWSLDAAGPIARAVADLALLLQAVAGTDADDESATPVPDYAAALRRPVGGMTIAVPRRFFFDKVEREIGDLIDAARAAFARLGARVVGRDIPDTQPAFDHGMTIAHVEAAAIHRRWLAERPQDYDHGVAEAMTGGLSIAAVDYAASLQARATERRRWLGSVFADADLLLTPVYEHATPTLEASDPTKPGAIEWMYATFGRCTRPFSFLGFPALALPCGFQPDGMPAALQLVARPFGEETLLAAGAAYQRATEWHLRHPPSPKTSAGALA